LGLWNLEVVLMPEMLASWFISDLKVFKSLLRKLVLLIEGNVGVVSKHLTGEVNNS